MDKVLVVGGSSYYHDPFRKFGTYTCDAELLWTNPRDIALVLFTGGADVSPALYRQEAARGTNFFPRRDIYESIVFRKAIQLGTRMVGVCRGSQFLNVMAGGKLVQHLDGHGFWHNMKTIDGRMFEVSSTHHQMSLPTNDSLLIGWSAEKRSYGGYIGDDNKRINPEPKHETEVIYWPTIRGVGMQYHPEIMSEHTQGFRFASGVVEKYLFA